jgi:2-oxopent-4-enoate/cis-2-oxohex-4-enoate hydratase
MISRRLQAGERIVGKKIGVTSAAVMNMLGVYQPDFVMPCFEIVASRIRDWKIKIQDTVADNASCGMFVLGSTAVDPRKLDLMTCGMVLEKNGEIIATGAGAAALGSPVNAVAWLANTLGRLGIGLKAGEVILSGALAAMFPAKAGDHFRVTIGGIGGCSVRFH